jgi:hypothetical protein
MKNKSVVITGIIIVVCCAILLVTCPVDLVGDVDTAIPNTAIGPGTDEPNTNTNQPDHSIIISYNLQEYVPVPMTGTAPVKTVTYREDMNVTVIWQDSNGNGITANLESFERGVEYRANILLKVKGSYRFNSDMAFAYPDGAVVEQNEDGRDTEERTVTVRYKLVEAPKAVTAGDLTGYIKAPLLEGLPVRRFVADQYTGQVIWKYGGGTKLSGFFAGNTVYTAEATLYTAAGYTFAGIPQSGEEGAFTHSGTGMEVNHGAGEGAALSVTVTFPATDGSRLININTVVSGAGPGWSYDATQELVSITEDGAYTIEGTGVSTTNRVKVAGVTAVIILEAGVDIGLSEQNDACAFDIESGADVDLILAASSDTSLKSGGARAGIQAPAGSRLTIRSAGGKGSRAGKLSATGGEYGAGIGGGNDGDGGEITIMGGMITAQGGTSSAGIGGGNGGNGGIITINDGTVTATGGDYGGAGIGGGKGDNSNSTATGIVIGGGGGTIAISGGTVTATGGNGNGEVSPSIDFQKPGSGISGGAGIGGGSFGPGGTIQISGGFVWAYSSATGEAVAGNDNYRDENGDPPAIGGGSVSGNYGDAGDITISGGTVIAITESAGAAIGGGRRAIHGSITISGGTIIALYRPGWEGSPTTYDEYNDGTIGLDTDPFGNGGYGHTVTEIVTSDGTPPVIFAYGIQFNNGHNRRDSGIGFSARPIHATLAISGNPPTPGSTGTITLLADFTVPAGATLTLPPGWTLYKNGKQLYCNSSGYGVASGNIQDYPPGP